MQLDNARPRPIAVGDRIHGYCGGYFGRDHYDCGTVEAVGKDWVVARSPRGEVFVTTGHDILMQLTEYRNESVCLFYYDQEMCTFYGHE